MRPANEKYAARGEVTILNGVRPAKRVLILFSVLCAINSNPLAVLNQTLAESRIKPWVNVCDATMP